MKTSHLSTNPNELAQQSSPLSDHWFGLGLFKTITQSAGRFLKTLELMDQVRRERRALAQLSDSDFRDMGLDRATALNESARSYFDLPATRLKQIE